MARRPTFKDWMLLLGFDTSSAITEMDNFVNYLEGELNQLTDRRIARWIEYDIKKTKALKREFQQKTRVGMLGEITANAVDKLHQRVLSDWTGKMNVRTGNYLGAITKSQNFRDGDTIYGAVGNVNKLNRATALSKEKAPGWEFKGDGKVRRPAKKKDPGGDSGSGYWYFQEFGFRHRGSNYFIRNQVFGAQDSYMSKLQQDMINEYDKKVAKFLGGRFKGFI